MVKLFGWELKMNQRIAAKRDEELLWIWKLAMLQVAINLIKFVSSYYYSALWLNRLCSYVIPFCVMLITFWTYVRLSSSPNAPSPDRLLDCDHETRLDRSVWPEYTHGFFAYSLQPQLHTPPCQVYLTSLVMPCRLILFAVFNMLSGQLHLLLYSVTMAIQGRSMQSRSRNKY